MDKSIDKMRDRITSEEILLNFSFGSHISFWTQIDVIITQVLIKHIYHGSTSPEILIEGNAP